MRILLTNDDGIAAPGLTALFRAIRDLGDVQVVAPATVQSAMSHAVTFHRPIATRKHVESAEGEDLFDGIAVAGSPADCVKLALATLLPEPIDLVVSGMNSGANVGVNVIYSGTVAAAMEAAFLGVPAIAVSLHIGDWDNIQYPAAAAHARTVIDRILAGPVEPHTVLNVNVPILDHGEPRGVRVVPISKSPLLDAYDHHEHDDGGRHYQARSSMTFHDMPANTDVEALFDRYITVTPLHFDLTRHDLLAGWEKFMARGKESKV
jgi:5'-nucleotidase